MLAWILIPTPLSTCIASGIIFLLGLILGVLLIVYSNSITEIVLDYTDCHKSAGATLEPIKSSDRLPNSHIKRWSWDSNSKICKLEFEIPPSSSLYYGDKPAEKTTSSETGFANGPVFVYIQISGMFQIYRNFAKSYSKPQLKGSALTFKQLKKDCEPLVGPESSLEENDPMRPVYYPCGLLPNSYFLDEIKDFHLMKSSSENGPNQKVIKCTHKAISWGRDLNKSIYGRTSYVQTGPSDDSKDITPAYEPPAWSNAYGHKTDDEKKWSQVHFPPDLSFDETFPSWMRLSSFSNFRKLWKKCERDQVDASFGGDYFPAGVYHVDIQSIWDAESFGRKSIVVSHMREGRLLETSKDVLLNMGIGLIAIAAFALAFLLCIIVVQTSKYLPKR